MWETIKASIILGMLFGVLFMALVAFDRKERYNDKRNI